MSQCLFSGIRTSDSEEKQWAKLVQSMSITSPHRAASVGVPVDDEGPVGAGRRGDEDGVVDRDALQRVRGRPQRVPVPAGPEVALEHALVLERLRHEPGTKTKRMSKHLRPGADHVSWSSTASTGGEPSWGACDFCTFDRRLGLACVSHVSDCQLAGCIVCGWQRIEQSTLQP